MNLVTLHCFENNGSNQKKKKIQAQTGKVSSQDNFNPITNKVATEATIQFGPLSLS